MSLCFEIKFLDFLGIVYSFRINFCIAQDNTFPNSFICLFKRDVNKLLVLDRPIRVINLYFLLKFTINDRSILSLNFDKETFGLNLDVHLFRTSALWYRNLQHNLLNILTPIIFVKRCPIICADLGHVFRGLRLFLLGSRFRRGVNLSRSYHWLLVYCIFNFDSLGLFNLFA